MTLMAAVFIAGAIGLTRLSFRVTRPFRGPLADRKADDIYSVRSKAITIFVPSALDELARGLPDLSHIETHEDIKTCLRQRGLERTWYAIIYRQFESNGNVEVMPVSGRPFETSSRVFEFRAVLATIRGNPPHSSLVDYSEATISLIPEELANSEPGEAMADLLRSWELAQLRMGH